MTHTDPLIGTVLHDTHRIVGVLGHGGMGTVYEAVHVRLTRQRFAIKVLHEGMVDSGSYYERFRQEAEVVSGIGHRNIITVVDFYHTAQGQPCIVMEYLEGEDLGRRLRRQGKLRVRQALRIVEQVGDALQAVHDVGVVHRDVKPGNIFLLDEGGQERIKVLDFGISKLVDRDGRHLELTGEHDLVGTPQFMSPEQIDEGLEIDHQTDIFSLGTITYLLLSGHLPFDASSMAGVIYKICNGEPEPLSSHVPLIPAEVKRVVHRALTKDRLMRYQRVADFVADLGHALELGWGISTDNRDALAELATDTVRETPQAARPRQDRETEVLPVVSEPPSEMEPATPPDPAAALTARGTQVLWHGDLLLAPPVGPLYSAPTEIPSPPSAPEARSASFQTTLSSSSGQSRRHAAVKAPGRRLLGLGALIGCTVAVFALGAYITLHSLGEGPQASGESITAATPAPESQKPPLPSGTCGLRLDSDDCAPVTEPLKPQTVRAADVAVLARALAVGKDMSQLTPPVAPPQETVRIRFLVRPTGARVHIIGQWRRGGTLAVPRDGKVKWFKVRARGHQQSIGSFVARRDMTIRVTLSRKTDDKP